MQTNKGNFYKADCFMRLENDEGILIDIFNDSIVYCIKVENENVFFSYGNNNFQLSKKSFNLYFKPCYFKPCEITTEDGGYEHVEESDSQKKISDVLDSMKSLLLYKNRKYGDSALHPNNVFYKGDSTNSILIRLDDKLGRIKNNNGEIRVNDVCDLIGYLTLLLVSLNVDKSEIDKLKD